VPGLQYGEEIQKEARRVAEGEVVQLHAGAPDDPPQLRGELLLEPELLLPPLPDGRELGEATYRRLFAKAAESFPDQAALQGFLAGIERPEARTLIYETILALAAADSISAEEEPLIVWLHEAWQIQ
jgi:hypothetical protein